MEINNELINAEIAKIEGGSRNERELLEYLYLDVKSASILESLPRIGSSRDKDEEIYRWRYAEDKKTLLAWPLMQRRAASLDMKIKKLQDLERVDGEKFAKILPELEKMKMERDILKAEYYGIIAKYDEIVKRCKTIEDLNIYLNDLQLKADDILKVIKDLSEEELAIFWKSYFESKEKFIGSETPVPTYVGGGLGE